MKNKPLIAVILASMLMLAFLTMCKKQKSDPESEQPAPLSPYSDVTNTCGFGVLKKLRGIWNGPVTSTTALGSYNEWIVDFRPISASQISAKNELDSLNSIHMSFFVAKYKNEYRVCFRNGGQFAGQTRVSYFLADSVAETTSAAYYRFSEVKKGKSRAYTEVILRNDSLYIKSYTNHYNTLSSPALHMSWSAKLQDTTSCVSAVNQFAFPQKVMAKDFSSAFDNDAEAVYYNGADPYNEAAQPYLGQSTLSYTFAPGFTPVAAKKVLLIITTQPLISGFNMNLANLKYRSRYVILDQSDHSFTFNYMHPGSYYLYAVYDADDNKILSSGDWVSTANTAFTLPASGTTSAVTQINFIVP